MSIGYFDFGGTHLRGVVEGDNGSKTTYDLDDRRDDIFSALDFVLSTHPDIKSIGISFAGQVHNNIIVSAPNIDAKNLDIASKYKKQGITVKVDNDLKCAALAEADCFGSGFVSALYVGTGIGSAYVNDGKVVGGSKNIAGEIGHIPYKDIGIRCGCGKIGCLEVISSGSGLSKRLSVMGLETMSLLEIAKNPEISFLADEFVDGVAYAASLILTLLNPQILVLGGGIVSSNGWLVETVRQKVVTGAFFGAVDSCEIVSSKLQNGSLEGARLLAL